MNVMSGLDIENRHIRQYRQYLSLQLRLMKLLLKEWKDTLHEMRMKHPELRLFKIHKVFQMFSALQSENIETLVQEMLLLFTDEHQTGLGLLQAIKVSIDSTTNKLLHVPSSSTAIERPAMYIKYM